MQTQEITLHATNADLDFDVVRYGSKGRPAIAFPIEDSSCLDWENTNLLSALEPLIEKGIIQLFCVDSLDAQSWFAQGAKDEYRLANLGSYLDFVAQDLTAYIEATTNTQAPMLIGCGVGALNALVALLQEPARYSGVVALPQTLFLDHFGAYSQEWEVYSPLALLRALTSRKKATKQLKEVPLAFACSSNSSAEESLEQLQEQLVRLGIEATNERWDSNAADSDWRLEALAELVPSALGSDALEERIQSTKIAKAEHQAAEARLAAQERKDELARAQKALAEAELATQAAIDRCAAEQKQLKTCSDTEEKLIQAAQKAWAKKDKAQKALDEAMEKGHAAQHKADVAAQRRSEAEWILGEARAELENATTTQERAQAHVEALKKEAEEADQKSKKAKAALNKVKGS